MDGQDPIEARQRLPGAAQAHQGDTAVLVGAGFVRGQLAEPVVAAQRLGRPLQAHQHVPEPGQHLGVARLALVSLVQQAERAVERASPLQRLGLGEQVRNVGLVPIGDGDGCYFGHRENCPALALDRSIARPAIPTAEIALRESSAQPAPHDLLTRRSEGAQR